MEISELISGLMKHGNVEREVYITLYERDSDGCVLSKRKYPIEAVFSHKESEADIYIEQSKLIEV